MFNSTSAGATLRSFGARIAAVAAACGVLAFGAVATADHHQDRRDRMTAHQQDKGHEADLSGMRVAILTGEGFHDGETLIPMAYMQNRGAKVTVIGPEKRFVRAYNSDMVLKIEKQVSEVKIEDFDALILPGGRAPANIREDSHVVEFAGEFFKSGKPVAAICHGPQVLITAGVMDGVEATCFSDVRSELREAGATYHDRPVVVHKNLITSRVPDDIPAFCAAMATAMVEHKKEKNGSDERARDRQRDGYRR